MAIDRDKILLEAQRLSEGKRYDKAAALYQRVLLEDPNDVRVLLKLGDTYLKLELFTEAISTYERVGQIYAKQSSALKAITVYKRVREMVERHAPALEERYSHILPRLAELYTQLGLTSDALSAYDTVATKLQRAGREREAVEVFRKVVDLDPSNPLAYLRLADAHVRVRDIGSAVKHFGSAADILAKLGRQNDALKVIDRLLQHQSDPDWSRRAAEIYLDRGGGDGDARAALGRLQTAYKDNPRDLATLSLLARTFDALGQPKKAVEVLKEAARIAREASKVDAFEAILRDLLARAPHDEAVQALARGGAARAAGQRPSTGAQALRPGGHDARDAREPTPPPYATIAQADAAHPPHGPDDYRDAVDSVVELDDELIEEDEDVELEPHGAAEAPFPMPRAHLDPSSDPAVRAKQLIARAELLRQSRDYQRAAEVLRHGVLELPAAHELREKLCDMLIEAGDQQGAVAEMLVFAEYLAEHGDAPGAARVLDEILLLEPGHADAVLMLSSLGYMLPQPGGEASLDVGFAPEVFAPEVFAAVEHAYAQHAYDDPNFDPNPPLPSYDLEQVDPSEALSATGTAHGAYARAGGYPLYGSSSHHAPLAPSLEDAPLPRFGDEDESTSYMDMPAMSFSAIEEQNAHSPLAETGTHLAHAAHAAHAAHGQTAANAQLDEDALEEIEFFTAQGMIDEARALLAEQIAKLPNHPLLLEKQRELEGLATAAAAAASHTAGEPHRPRAFIAAQPAEDRSFDIAASLDALDGLGHDGHDRASPETGRGGPSVDAVIRQFKAGVAATVSPDDAATHYDLGSAYKDMGLFPDAIAEFELAARDPHRECVCRSMIGIIHLQLGNVDAAIDSFLRGLEGPQKTPEQEVSLHYDIGSAYEQRKNLEQALYYFQKAARIDPKYGQGDPRGSVEDRIRKLDSTQREKPKTAREEEMDLDSVFDNLMGSK